ncbi:hypothetical protein [Flagellimonas sp.]|uniref:hypothetical protein n=1 Tax=Flagellimonas sp. TaxID=2058762 RepID=UPI003B500117
MVKKYGFRVLTILPCFLAIQMLKSQTINIPSLDRQLFLSDKDIALIRKKKKIFYWDKQQNQKLFSKGFHIAYPFFEKAALVQEEGKYGIIDRNGGFLIEPVHETFELAPFPHEAHIVIFKDLVFDLNTGHKTSHYLRDEEPAPPKIQKGIKWSQKSDYEFISKNYDSIIAIGVDFVLVSNKGKIGIADLDGNPLSEQDYEEVQFTEKYPHGIISTIGLRKEKRWHYFQNGKKFLESPYACQRFDVELPNAVGVFYKNKRYKVLFKDGGISKKGYDLISKNALAAKRKNKTYLLNGDGKARLLHQD